jgi:hypothetical protein
VKAISSVKPCQQGGEYWPAPASVYACASRRVAGATACLNRVLAPEGEFLSFAPPKKRNQRKGGPDAALILRSSLLNGVDRRGSLPLCQRNASLHCPSRAVPFKSSGARRGIRGKTIPKSEIETKKTISNVGRNKPIGVSGGAELPETLTLIPAYLAEFLISKSHFLLRAFLRLLPTT